MEKIAEYDIKRNPKRRIHVHPDYYGVYLLRSTPKPRSFYIGSTPNPKRRLRQHNGELKNGGAYRTKKEGFRPWEMICLVYNFPSKNSALQFEHALQHPYQTRHIKKEARITQKRNTGYSLHHRLGNIRLLLASLFFSRMGLKVLVFDQEVYSAWCINKFGISVTDNVQVIVTKFEEYFSADNVDDCTSLNICNLKNSEMMYFEACKRTLLFDGEKCLICNEHIDYQPESLSSRSQLDLDAYLRQGHMRLVAICYHENCQKLYHLKCLGLHFLNNEDHSTDSEESQNSINYLIPIHGKCLNCNNFINWSKLSRMSTKLREYFLKPLFDLETTSQLIENEGDD